MDLTSSKPRLDDTDKALLEVMQDEFPLVDNPYVEIAKRVGVSEAAVLSRLKRLIEQGSIRKFRALVDKSRLGITANTLIGMKVPPERLEEVMKQEIKELSLAVAGIDLQLALQEVRELKLNLSLELQAVRDDRRAQQREFQEFISGLWDTLDQIRAKHLIEAQLLDCIGDGNAGEKQQRKGAEAQMHRVLPLRQ